MKVAVIPDGAMILINLINKNDHTYISSTNFTKREADDIAEDGEVIDKSKPPYNLTKNKILKNSKFVPDEAPSGVKGRLSLIMDLVEDAEAVIILSKKPVNYKPLYDVLNELIMFGSSGCVNAQTLTVNIFKERKIPKLILKHPTSQEEQVDLINTTNKFLENLDKYKGQDIVFNEDNINFELKEDLSKYSYNDLKNLFRSQKFK